MSKITLTIELEYQESHFPKDDSEAYDWFINHILYEDKGKLRLHSDEIGDLIGKVTVIGKQNSTEPS